MEEKNARPPPDDKTLDTIYHYATSAQKAAVRGNTERTLMWLGEIQSAIRLVQAEEAITPTALSP